MVILSQGVPDIIVFGKLHYAVWFQRALLTCQA